MAKHFTVDTGGTLTTGLVSYFKLDSDSSDYFGSHNGTDVASPTYGTGKVNNAITYNGSSQYTHFATAYSLTDASFSCWIKTSTSSGVRITSEYDTVSGSGWVLCLTLNEFTGGKPTFRLINYGVGGSTNCTGTTTVNDNAWHNIVGIRNGSTYTIWVDGSLNTTITSGNTTTTTAVLNLSGEVYGNSLFTPFPGSIDEFGIWSKALSSQEIADLYNGGSGQTMVNPTAYTATESDSIMNAASRLATVGRVSSFFRSVSATIMNAASRLASVAAIRNVPRSMSDSMMAATSVIDSGLMAWWKFDEGSGTSATDSSGNGQTLTWSGNKVGAGGTTYYATGIVGPYAGIYDGVNTSLAGSGTSYFNMGTSSFSYGGWANITGWTNGLVLMRTGGDNGTISPGFNVRTNGNTGQLSAYICDGTIRPAISINNVPVNTWCHFFVTVDTTSHVMTFYMNGVSAGTASISSLGNVTQNSSMAVGSAHYSGSLDDCRVYNRLLSAAEVARLYNVSPYPNGTVSKLVSFFRSVSATIMNSASRFAVLNVGLVKKLTDSIMNATGRLATVTRVRAVVRVLSDTIMNAASRFASLTSIAAHFQSMTDSVMNGASRFATVTGLRTAYAYLSDAMMIAKGRYDKMKAMVNGLFIQFMNRFSSQGTSFSDKYTQQGTTFSDKYSKQNTEFEDKFQ